MKKFSIPLVLMSFFGNVLIGLGISVCRFSHWGIDPFTSMNTGVSSRLGISLGLYAALLNLVMFIVLVALDRKNFRYLNIGALINMFLLGYMIQSFTKLFCGIAGTATPEEIPVALPMQIVYFAISVLIITLGCSLYMTADLGAAPYDALSIYLTEIQSKVPFSICRMIQDGICALIAVIFKGPLGLATIFLALFMGPFISTWTKLVSKPLLAKIQK